jgi:hypothetical protein
LCAAVDMNATHLIPRDMFTAFTLNPSS